MRFPVFIIFCYKQTSPLEVPKYVFGFGLFILPQFSPPTVEDVKKVQTAKRKYDRIANEGNRFAISFFYANANINVGQELAPALQYLTIFCYINN